MLKEKQPYQGLSEREYEEKFCQRELNSLQRRVHTYLIGVRNTDA